ncbi:unnamed protein product [Effrenium voratum]|uniref:cellulase n=1 Tax=Effrenium voratum TaxID=2562239 RepID=A0AA36JHC6_9DINO|nr:unnamed protein product [Effrenium voratum]
MALRVAFLVACAWPVAEAGTGATNRSLAQSNASVGGCGNLGCSSCGRCFNAGSRGGATCRGPGGSTGYNCPAEASSVNGILGAYACMDWTFGSSALRGAEADFRGQAGQDVYFGVGTYGTSSDPQRGLGACYRMKVEGVDKDIIAQSINTGWDVHGNQFDLQIGAGGTGAFNQCAGGSGSMFAGGKGSWGCTYGGVDTMAQCRQLPSAPQRSQPMRQAGDSLVELCEYSFRKNVRLSGADRPAGACKYNPTILDLSRVMLALRGQKCESENPGASLSYCLTRMMDCRKPSGAFKDNLRPELMAPGKKVLQTCTSDGYTRIDVSCGCSGCMC